MWDARHDCVRPGTHYRHVTWAHVMSRVPLGCERRFNIEFYGADSHFCHPAYVTWSHVELWEACWHVSRPVLHVRSRDASWVKEVWICPIEFNVKSPLTSQPHAWHHMSSRDVRIVCPRPKRVLFWIRISVALVRERTIPTERPPPVGEVSANFCG